MYVSKFSIENQQKIISGLDDLNMKSVVEWFNKFGHKEETIVKIELSSIDIEKIFNNRLFFKNELDAINNCTYEELILEDILDWNIVFPNSVKKMQLGHPIVLKRKLTHDDLHNCIYCFKGTLKAIEKILSYNSLQWSSKANRTDEQNETIGSVKGFCPSSYRKSLGYFDYQEALIEDEDYEIIDRIYDVYIMEELLEDDEVPFKELIEKRLIEFTESQDQEGLTYTDDYNW